MTERLPQEPSIGTIGIGVLDGAYEGVSSADEIRECATKYFRRSGVRATEFELLGLGSTAGGFMESVVQNIWASLAILAASKFLAFLRGTRDRKFAREQNDQLLPCFIHLQDHREERSNAIEILRLLPGLQAQLNQDFPNRNYTFSIHSSLKKPKLQRVYIRLENYDDIGLTTRAIIRKIARLSDSEFVSVYLRMALITHAHTHWTPSRL